MDNKSAFPVGTKVKLRPEAVDFYNSEFARRVKGRVGVVTGHSFPSEYPLVTLLKEGRKEEYRLGAIRTEDWEVLEIPGLST